MKKKLVCATLHGGFTPILVVEYRYIIFGIVIPVTLIVTRNIKRELTSSELDKAILEVLK